MNSILLVYQNIETMGIFNSKEEALESRIKYLNLNGGSASNPTFIKHSKKWDFYEMDDKFNHRNMGKFFLYEKVIYKQDGLIEVYYPKLGIYLNELPCDQTTEVEWIDCRRTYEWNIQYKYIHTDKDGNDSEFKIYLGEKETEIQRLPLWWDELLVYGAWDSMPSWKQLKQAYERTWWFYRSEDEKRDIQLNRILG